MVIGIIALVVGFVPFCGAWAIIPAAVGIVLGMVDVIVKSKRNEKRGQAIAGLVLNPLAIAIVVTWWVLAAIAANEAGISTDPALQQQIFQGLQGNQNYQNRQQNAPVAPLPGSPDSPKMEPMQPVDSPSDTSSEKKDDTPPPAEAPAPAP